MKDDVNFPAEVFARLTDAESPATLPEIAKAKRIPRGEFVAWFTTQHRDKYDAALRVLTDQMAFDAIKIADAIEGEDESARVAAAKLRVDTRLRTAARWDRERYGEREPANVAVIVPLGDLAREIRELESKLGIAAPRVIDVAPVKVETEEAPI